MWNKLSMNDRAAIIRLAVSNGITNLDTIRKGYNKYAEGGLKDSWKPWYWGIPKYEGENLKEALFKAYDDGLEGKNMMYNGKAYKVALNDVDLKEYNTKKQHELNRTITDEQVVDSYINNVLYVMENPNHKGLKNSKYYPYADSSSPKNIGPGINYTSDMGKNLDFSGKTGYSREFLDSLIREDLMLKMKDIRSDLHDMYGEDSDTLGMGKKQTLLDLSHNVRPRGSKKANMPKKWPSLVKGMMLGDFEMMDKNTYSGSTRRQLLRNTLLRLNQIYENSLQNI